MEAVASLFDRVDVLVGPVAAGPMLIASNFTGHPCLVLPAGFERVPTRLGTLACESGTGTR